MVGHYVARASPRQVHVTFGDYVINSAVEPLPAYTFGVLPIQVWQRYLINKMKLACNIYKISILSIRLCTADLNLSLYLIRRIVVKLR